MRACDSPTSFDELVRYWADDLGDEQRDALEQHLFGCAACTAASARVAQLSEAIRALVPPIVTAAKVEVLRQKGLRVAENLMLPGERREVEFPRDVDLLVHVLSGLNLESVERVSFVLRTEGSGQVLVALDDVPFDRGRRALLLACQQHYAFLPHDTVAEVTTHGAQGSEESQAYVILHRYAR